MLGKKSVPHNLVRRIRSWRFFCKYLYWMIRKIMSWNWRMNFKLIVRFKNFRRTYDFEPWWSHATEVLMDKTSPKLIESHQTRAQSCLKVAWRQMNGFKMSQIPRGRLLIAFGGFTVGGYALVNHCMYNVEGGHRAVLYNRFGGMSDKAQGEAKIQTRACTVLSSNNFFVCTTANVLPLWLAFQHQAWAWSENSLQSVTLV